MRGEPLPPVWVAVGLDPISRTVTILGVAQAEADSKAHQSRADDSIPYRHSFNFMSDTIGRDMLSWLRHYKVPDGDARQVLRDLADSIKDMMDGKRSAEAME